MAWRRLTPQAESVRTPRTPHTILCLVAVLLLSACVVPATGQAPTSVQRQLDELTVAVSVSMSGYSRGRFPHWRPDGGGSCNVRDTVLRRDGSDIRVSRGCNVVDGQWYSPYDDTVLHDPDKVDIDHMVPLANAWRSGASSWDDQKRGDFANDLARPELLAVSASSNRAKGDQDPAQWRPPNRSYWCEYAVRWIAVKHGWRLTVTTAEKAALSEMLRTCQTSSAPPTSPLALAG